MPPSVLPTVLVTNLAPDVRPVEEELVELVELVVERGIFRGLWRWEWENGRRIRGVWLVVVVEGVVGFLAVGFWGGVGGGGSVID